MFSKRKRKVRMHISEGPSIEGILMLRSRAHYVLRAATVLRDEHQSFTTEGEIRIPAARVLFFQVLDE